MVITGRGTLVALLSAAGLVLGAVPAVAGAPDRRSARRSGSAPAQCPAGGPAHEQRPSLPAGCLGLRPGTPVVQTGPGSRIDVGSIEPVDETDEVVTYRLPVSVSGRGTGQVRLTSIENTTGLIGKSRLVTVRPGTHHLDIAVDVAGDTAFGYGSRSSLLAQAVGGSVVVGAYQAPST